MYQVKEQAQTPWPIPIQQTGALRSSRFQESAENGFERTLDRCDIYEWKKTAAGEAALCDRAGRPGTDGLGRPWENWRSPAGEWVRSFAIITTTPNELCAELHNRMPAVLAPQVWSEWLGEQPAGPPRLKRIRGE
jgi:hypothetical protein